MEFNLGNSPQDDNFSNRQKSTASYSAKSPLGVIVILAIIAVVGGFTYFNSHKPVVSSGISEDLKIERLDGIAVKYDKKFEDKKLKLDYDTFVWTSDYSGPCEPVIEKATWDRAGKFITLTKTSGSGCVLTKHRFQQRISPADGSKFPVGTQVKWDRSSK